MLNLIKSICWALLIMLVLSKSSMVSADSPLISKIEIEGNKIIDTAAIRTKISSLPGSSFDELKITNDLKELYRTGYFAEVEAQKKQEPSLEAAGRVENILLFVVKERSTIRNVFVEGNKAVDNDSFKDKMGGSIRRFFDERKIKVGLAEVLKSYQEKGYRQAKIEYQTELIDDSQVDLTFVVDEGSETLIREVVFEGNSTIANSELANKIETTRYKWWSSWLFGTGVVQKDLLARDVSALHEFYLTQGHVNVRVTEPEIVELEDGLKVVFKIDEGPIFKINSVSAAGTLFEESEEKTLAGIELKAGDIFNVELMRKDVFKIHDKFADIGYAFANVAPDPRINQATETIDLHYIVDKGNENYINRINISGHQKTRDNVIRRNIRIQEGELYSSSKIERSRELIERTGYFDEVILNTEPSIYEDQVDLDFDVKEGRTGSFNIGAGFSTLDGLILMAKLSENNILGTGNALELDLNTGTEYKTYSLGLSNPRIDDTQWSGGINAFMTDREYDDFYRKQTGGSVSVGYPLWFLDEKYLDDIRFNLTYELSQIDIYHINDSAASLVREQGGKSVSSSITPTLIRNTINNPLDPTSGSKQTVSFEVAGLGGDQKFWLFGASNTLYLPLVDSKKLVFSNRMRLDYGDVYNTDGKFPMFRRFFPGGINTVRGYKAREMGPKDERGREYGGNKQFISNYELIFPIFSEIGLKGVIFYDIGQAFDDEQSIRFSKLKLAWGWGFRWRTPMAPIRLEFGYPINPEKNDHKGMIVNFSFGMPN
ncbi:MAG: outer membrane protein assembly factor BamA [Deltaproteobacteria bacterium]|jgi:outer membrane protein insertion porin family|nr:outer membrane protein assembly factor BamA [Deltaproteobacteria bacterium]